MKKSAKKPKVCPNCGTCQECGQAKVVEVRVIREIITAPAPNPVFIPYQYPWWQPAINICSNGTGAVYNGTESIGGLGVGVNNVSSVGQLSLT